ncbi:hypothetical protein U1Q18_048838, partial [Sarracenia purpurea var. burkii]
KGHAKRALKRMNRSSWKLREEEKGEEASTEIGKKGEEEKIKRERRRGRRLIPDAPRYRRRRKWEAPFRRDDTERERDGDGERREEGGLIGEEDGVRCAGATIVRPPAILPADERGRERP